MGNSQSNSGYLTPSSAEWISDQNQRFTALDNERHRRPNPLQQHPVPPQQQNKPFQKPKPTSLKEPAFSGYVAGWRQGDCDSDAQEFSFASFQYSGDDEEEGESLRSDWPLGAEDERTWKERKHSPSPAAPERVGRSASRATQSGRSQTISCPRRYLSAATTTKMQNSSHSAVVGRHAGHGPVAKVSVGQLRRAATEDAAMVAARSSRREMEAGV
ncbi:Hypothetical predicted protein [Lecanosticta acicola]|uniref:Uncharacterized protein n=1 Tax=Lecanosticta acicola TaxID=111012 RepID=A0AAI8Z6H4_9PEZI|nr:Hypothetical predicted protein [Lecanosticta acicola]